MRSNQLNHKSYFLGYEYWEDHPDPERMFFVKGMPPFGEKRRYHVHLFTYNSAYWNDRIAFRDYLRKHPDLVQEYAALKLGLAKKYGNDRERYTVEKTDFIKKVLELAK